MGLMVLDIMKAKSLSRKSKDNLQSKKIEHRLLLELSDKLKLLLDENDRVMLEINPKVVAEFINILSDRLLVKYDYEQHAKNIFVFYNKESDLFS